MDLDTSKNSSFSPKLPGLQLAIDSTSLGAFKECPRKYYYSIILGWQPKDTSVHLVFGILMHSGTEQYHHARSAGESHENALEIALHWVLKVTWDKKLGRPWISGDSYKNRLTLIRTLLWYLDQWAAENLDNIILSNGKPAVELSFHFDSGYQASTGESFLFCGHLDRLVMFNGQPWISDIKTTKSELSPYFWQQFNPNNQFSMYMLAGQVAFAQPVQGIIVDGAQVLVDSSRFQRHPIPYDKSKIDEWYLATGWWIAKMDECAQAGSWPMNEKSCSNYGGCPFLAVCAKPPGAREQWLKADFRQRIWDPMQKRGDI